MKYRKILLATIILVAILAIGAVSAADDLNETQDSAALTHEEDNIIADNINDDNISDDETIEEEYENPPDYSIYVPEKYTISEHETETFISWDFWDYGSGGILDVYVDDAKLYSAKIDEKPDFSLTPDDLGIEMTYRTYKVNVSYHDDDTYDGFNQTYTLIGNWGFKAYPQDEIEGFLRYGDDLPIDIVLRDAQGDVSYTVNGKKYTISKDKIDKNYEEFSYALSIAFDQLKIGENTLTFTYTGSDYPSDTDKIVLDVYPRIILNDTVIDFDKKTNVYLNLQADAKGSLNVYEAIINDEEDTIESYKLIGTSPLKDGFASVDISGLDLGKHAIYANYTGSDYTASLGEFDYSYEPYLEVTPAVEVASKIYSKDKNYLTITLPETYEGTLTLIINGDKKSVNVKNGKGSIELFNLESDDSTWSGFWYVEIDLSFESENYTYHKWIGVEVNRIAPEFELNISAADDLKGSEYFYYSTHNLPSEITGSLKIYIDGKFVETQDIDLQDSLNISALDLGEHTLKIDYMGDDYYKATSAEIKFNVVEVIIDIDEINYIGTYPDYTPDGRIAEIRSIYENGYYTLIVDGKITNMDIADKHTEVYAENMTYGPHEVEIIYRSGNTEKSEKSLINAQYDLSYNIEKYSMYSYETNTIEFNVPLEVTGNLIVTADKDYTLPISNGKAVLKLANLSEGDHELKVKYDGDKYPELTIDLAILTVADIKREITSNIQDTMRYDEEIIFTVNVPEYINATLYIYDDTDGKVELKKVKVINGKATASIDNLGFGTHDLIAEVTDCESEDWPEYYADYSEQVNIMPLLNGTTEMLSEHLTLGDSVSFNVELPKDANGKLYLYREEYNETSEDYYEIPAGEYQLVNGKTTATLEKYGLGITTYKIKYDDAKYNLDTYAIYLNVHPTFTYPEKMTIGSDEYFIINLPDDANGILEAFGVNTTVKNGVGKISLSGLPKGETFSQIKYTGDKIYGSYYSVIYGDGYIITVTNPQSSIQITKSDDKLTVELDEDATGEVIINVEDKFYHATLENGKATVDVADLKSDENVTFSYTGDEKYAPVSKKSVKIIEKTMQDANMTITAPNINEGEIATVTFKINSNATGSILVQVADSNYTAEITDGSASIIIENLKAGNYTVTATYGGNENVLGDSQTASFKVREIENDISEDIIPVKDAEASKTPTYSINLPEDATGTLTVTIANKTYTAEVVNGKASVTADDLPAGNYEVTISYSGDDKYSPMLKTANTTVLVDAKIVAKDASVLYTAGKYYSVTVYGTDGKISGNVSVVFKVNGKTFKTVLTNEKGIASFKVTQIPKTYTIKATALGESVTKKLTVSHIVTLKKVTVKKSAKKLVLQATLKKVNGKYLKGKKITFKFNGKTYKAKTDKKGIAKVTVKSNVLKKLKVGKKVTYQATYMKDTVKKTVKVLK